MFLVSFPILDYDNIPTPPTAIRVLLNATEFVHSIHCLENRELALFLQWRHAYCIIPGAS